MVDASEKTDELATVCQSIEIAIPPGRPEGPEDDELALLFCIQAVAPLDIHDKRRVILALMRFYDIEEVA